MTLYHVSWRWEGFQSGNHFCLAWATHVLTSGARLGILKVAWLNDNVVYNYMKYKLLEIDENVLICDSMIFRGF